MYEREVELLKKALDTFAIATDIKIEIEHYLDKSNEFDALGNLTIDGKKVPVAIEFKIRPTPALVMITKLKQKQEQILIVADYVNPILAERLKTENIWFVDTAGNAYIKLVPLFIYIKGNKPIEKPAARTLGRAFQPTGLKVIYAFLCNPELVNASYREIAKRSEVALGTVGWVMTDLTQLGNIVDMGHRGRRLKEKKKLLDRWVTAYSEKLRPKLKIGKYKAPDPDWWQKTDLHNQQAYWGGEVAADQLTHYLKPEIITIYVMKKWVGELTIMNKLRKDPNGDIEILNTFWNVDNEFNRKEIVNPILVYADLMATNDPRNIETAKIIYEQELAKLKFPINSSSHHA
jgi:hypothetical protein